MGADFLNDVWRCADFLDGVVLIGFDFFCFR